jgi:hypothetical protein
MHLGLSIVTLQCTPPRVFPYASSLPCLNDSNYDKCMILNTNITYPHMWISLCVTSISSRWSLRKSGMLCGHIQGSGGPSEQSSFLPCAVQTPAHREQTRKGGVMEWI